MQNNRKSQLTQQQQNDLLQKARQIQARVLFLRWSSNFKNGVLNNAPESSKVILLSRFQSSRFTYCVNDGTLFLGVQPFEQAWFLNLPYSFAAIDDKLYFYVPKAECMGVKLQDFTIALTIESQKKIDELKQANQLMLIPIVASEGKVVDIAAPVTNVRVILKKEPILSSLKSTQKETTNLKHLF